jgi:hypothetical protein
MQLFGGAILVFWAAAGLKNAAMPAKAIKKVEQRQWKMHLVATSRVLVTHFVDCTSIEKIRAFYHYHTGQL